MKKLLFTWILAILICPSFHSIVYGDKIAQPVSKNVLQTLYPDAMIKEINLLPQNYKFDGSIMLEDITKEGLRISIINTDFRDYEILPIFNGQWLSPHFADGLFPARSNGKWGYLGENYMWEISPDYDDVSLFSYHHAKVWKDGEESFIGTNGEIIKDLDFSLNFDEELVECEQSGNVAVATYESISHTDTGVPEKIGIKVFNKSGEVYQLESDVAFGVTYVRALSRVHILEDESVLLSMYTLSEGDPARTVLLDPTGKILGQRNGSTYPFFFHRYGDLLYSDFRLSDPETSSISFYNTGLDEICELYVPENRALGAVCNQNYLCLLSSRYEKEFYEDGDLKNLKCIPETLWIVIAKERMNKLVPVDLSKLPDFGTQIILNGEILEFDVAPQKENDRVLVPLRTIFEALGAEVSWNDERQQVTARREEITVELTIGEEKMLKNDEVIQLDVPAKLVKDRTLIPIRAAAEAFGAKVEWNEGTQTVIIETN